ncbi:MAG TPA: hypothetical protein VN726_12895 [Hanamia sp.]|nr:hypothetical protein [Hanamia sp.]
MKQIFSFLLSAVLCIILSHNASAQGCVAIRSTGGICTMEHGHSESPSKWVLNVNNRYFKSFRHFVGTKEQKQRIANGSEVINHSYTLDLTLTRNLNKWWSFSIDAPIVANTRSSLYEHDGKNRFSTHSFGLGDVRLSAYRWVVDPAKMPKGNIQFGLGIKLPTGDYKYQDVFHKNDSTLVLGPVDQSIQLGDGGLGFSTEMNAYYNVSKVFSFYGNLYYLLSPREQNGTLTSRGGTPSAASIKNGSFVMSVPDQYMIRAGANATLKDLTVSVGFRDECLPAHDLIRGSKGFRRPGYILSVEPGLTYNFKKVNVYAYVPIALERNRTQSVADIFQTKLTGVYTQGDAAFADYAVNVGFSVKF